MKTNRSSLRNASITPQVSTLRQRPQVVIPALLTKLVVVTAVIMLGAAVVLGSASQPPAPHVNNAVASSQLSRAAYLLTLPRQIQDLMAGRVSSGVAAASPAQQSAYILTLPRQIQDQMAGRTSSATRTSSAHWEAYIVTLPRQIQDQIRQTLTARSY